MILDKMLKEKDNKGVRCIVSFRNFKDPDLKWPVEDDKKFWISNWLP